MRLDLQTERMTFRPLTLNDLDQLAEIYSDRYVMRFIYGVHTREQTRQRILDNLTRYEEYGFGLWATILKTDEQLIGRCGLLPHTIDGRSEVEVAYTLARRYWGRGLATEAALAIRDYAFRTLPVDRVIAFVDVDNVASNRVAEKIGMRIERDVLFHGDPCNLYYVNRCDALQSDHS